MSSQEPRPRRPHDPERLLWQPTGRLGRAGRRWLRYRHTYGAPLSRLRSALICDNRPVRAPFRSTGRLLFGAEGTTGVGVARESVVVSAASGASSRTYARAPKETTSPSSVGPDTSGCGNAARTSPTHPHAMLSQHRPTPLGRRHTNGSPSSHSCEKRWRTARGHVVLVAAHRDPVVPPPIPTRDGGVRYFLLATICAMELSSW